MNPSFSDSQIVQVDQLILHQYAISPFSEKIRAILSFKDVPWTAVEIPGDRAEAGPRRADRRLPSHAGDADRRAHLLRHGADRRGARTPGADAGDLSGRVGGRRALPRAVGRHDAVLDDGVVRLPAGRRRGDPRASERRGEAALRRGPPCLPREAATDGGRGGDGRAADLPAPLRDDADRRSRLAARQLGVDRGLLGLSLPVVHPSRRSARRRSSTTSRTWPAGTSGCDGSCSRRMRT